MLLRDGTTSEDPRLDRLVQFDERSRSFRLSADDRPLRAYTWRCSAHLDQGREGACVGFACAHELAARPVELQMDATMARGFYYGAQVIDPWPGGEYPGASPRYAGTSVLAGVKVLHAAGFMRSYRWAFGLRDLQIGVGYHGPAIIGVNWYEGMFDLRDGFVHPSGGIAGGHALLVKAINLRLGAFRLHNSWGPAWGDGGSCWISFADMERLLLEDGEAVFFEGRRTPV